MSTMQSYPHLTKAPVAEAVVEIRVRLSRPVVQADFNAFRDRLKDPFPKAQNIRYVASHMQFGSDEELKNDVSTGMIGVRLDDRESRWVVQAKSDGLAISRLPPYESWDGLVATLRELWPVYVEVFEPATVLRLGVRYINRVLLPDTENVDLDTLLTAGPKIPPALPQALTQFVTRVTFPLPAEGIVLTVLQSLEPAPGDVAGRRAHVVLDIDAACEQTMSPDAPEMWGRLDSLRDAKNMAFFGSLTEPTWKGFWAVPTSAAMREADELLTALPQWCVAPVPTVEPSGAIAFEWDLGPSRWLVLALKGTGTIEHSAILGLRNEMHGTRNFAGTLGRHEIALLSELMQPEA